METGSAITDMSATQAGAVPELESRSKRLESAGQIAGQVAQHIEDESAENGTLATVVCDGGHERTRIFRSTWVGRGL